jgi:branched-subunit amino acid ABC-type transport system permease component
MDALAILPQILWTSFATASYQALFAAAFALVLKVTKIWNFAQPALMGLAFYAIYAANRLACPIPISVAIGCAVAAACGYLLDRGAFRNLRKRRPPPLTYFIFTLVLAQFVIFLLTLVFSTDPVFVQPQVFWPMRIVAGIAVSEWDVMAVAVSLSALIALWLFMSFTRMGQYLIAVAGNADLAQVYGISRDRCFEVSLILAGLLSALGMYLFGSRLVVYPELPMTLMTFAIAATIVGGIGNVFGAAIAAVAINIIQQLSILAFDSQWQPLIVCVILFGAILFFPAGVRLPRRRIRRPAGTIGIPAAPTLGAD